MLHYARRHGCAWSSSTCEAAGEEATWQCCSLPTRMAVPGAQKSAVQLPNAATSAF